VSNTWDSAGTVWDGAEWQAGTPPVPDWSTEWRWWYQLGDGTNVQNPTIDLMGLLVEARWTTDAHTMGDGTFRGDIQPGKATIRLWDPGHKLDNLNKAGVVFALYRPTGACWAFFYDSFARGLYAAGDPTDADCVFSGTQWPARLTEPRPNAETSWPAQSANARLSAIAANLAGTPGSNMILPVVTSSIAGQSQTVAATAMTSDPGSMWPGYLTVIRDAATNGVAWLAAQGVDNMATTGIPNGSLILNYARWETNNPRTLDRSQIIAGPAVTADAAVLITQSVFNATGPTGAASQAVAQGYIAYWGLQGPVMRLYGNVTGGQPENVGAANTAAYMVQAHSDPRELIIDSVDVQSGTHRTPTGGLSPTPWDPYGHTFSPVDAVTISAHEGQYNQYRVISSAHRLTATIWQTTHTVEKYVAAHPLP
jgi:hypothetical protein